MDRRNHVMLNERTLTLQARWIIPPESQHLADFLAGHLPLLEASAKANAKRAAGTSCKLDPASSHPHPTREKDQAPVSFS